MIFGILPVVNNFSIDSIVDIKKDGIVLGHSWNLSVKFGILMLVIVGQQ